MSCYANNRFRPFIVNFTKTSRNTITWSLILHVLLLSVTSVAVLRIPTAVINAYFTHVSSHQPLFISRLWVQPLNFDPFMRKSAMSPDRYLLAALQSQNPYHLVSKPVPRHFPAHGQIAFHPCRTATQRPRSGPPEGHLQRYIQDSTAHPRDMAGASSPPRSGELHSCHSWRITPSHNLLCSSSGGCTISTGDAHQAGRHIPTGSEKAFQLWLVPS